MKTNCFAQEVKWTDKRLRPKVRYNRKGKHPMKVYKPPEEFLGTINTGNKIEKPA